MPDTEFIQILDCLREIRDALNDIRTGIKFATDLYMRETGREESSKPRIEFTQDASSGPTGGLGPISINPPDAIDYMTPGSGTLGRGSGSNSDASGQGGPAPS